MVVNSNPITWDDPTAEDETHLSPTVECIPASNTNFVQGETIVICIATDAAGNNNACGFIITLGW